MFLIKPTINYKMYFWINIFYIKNLNVVNGWTIGKSNEFTIGLDINYYTEENELNIEALKKLAEKINNFKKLLNS